MKPGRPSLQGYADLFDVPAADGDLAVTFLGVDLHGPGPSAPGRSS